MTHAAQHRAAFFTTWHVANRGPARSITGKRIGRMAVRAAQEPDAAVAKWIEENLGLGKVTGSKFAGGSGWSSAYVYETAQSKRVFVKTALGRDADSMFQGEAAGLRAMHATNTIRVPEVYHYGPLPSRAPGGGALRGGGSFIVMQYLDLRGRCDQAELGRQLARMHLATPQHEHGKFGFVCDNTIGGTPQPNTWESDWVTFFREHRLRHMLKLANNSRLNQLAEPLLRKGALEALFEGVDVKPSILHGDLWSGNIAAVDGAPAIFDPACYYGHHEAEFGMSWCAGFGAAFWSAYHELLPRAKGFETRADLYELYHKLNHYVLFGSGYMADCDRLLSRLVKKL